MTKKILTAAAAACFALLLAACAGDGRKNETAITAAADNGPSLTVHIVPGPRYTHKIKVFPLIHITAAPQMAIWTEAPDGEFLTPLFVTDTYGKQSWRKAPGDKTKAKDIRRTEALPVFDARNGSAAAENDAVTGSTPKGGGTVEISLGAGEFSGVPAAGGRIVIFLEINSSLDFNASYPENALPGTPGYSGGPWGSGQPSLVYSAEVHLPERGKQDGEETRHKTVTMRLIGHGSPDGSDGNIHPGTDGISTALEIVDNVSIEIIQ